MRGRLRENPGWVVAAVAGAAAIVGFGLYLFNTPDASVAAVASNVAPAVAASASASAAASASPSSTVISLDSLPAVESGPSKGGNAASNPGGAGAAGGLQKPQVVPRPPVTTPTATTGSKYGRFE